jgi:uncharacterized protein YjbI with pentapeptide repeats
MNKKLDLIHNFLSDLRTFFFQGADFSKRNIYDGSFENCDLRGCDFRKTKLRTIDFSNTKGGRSFSRAILMLCIAILSFYIALDIWKTSQDLNLFSNYDNTSISDIVSHEFTSDLSLVFSLTWYFYNPYLSSFVYDSIYFSRLRDRGINIIKEDFFLGIFKVTSFIVKIYPKLFALAVKSTLFLYVGTDQIPSIINLFISAFDSWGYITTIRVVVAFTSIVLFATILFFVIFSPSYLLSKIFAFILSVIAAPIAFDTSFEDAQLADTSFCNASMNKVSFKKAILIHAKFQSTSLKFTNFTDSNLKMVDFQDSDLSCANFTNVKLENVNFQDANLDGAYYKSGDMIYHISTMPGLNI